MESAPKHYGSTPPSLVLALVPTVTSETSPTELDSRPLDCGGVSDETVGSGGCTAYALTLLGVFSSVGMAKEIGAKSSR
jgi:hypothetical protein